MGKRDVKMTRGRVRLSGGVLGVSVGLSLLGFGLAAARSMGQESSMSVGQDSMIAKTIEAYEPARLPERGELRGLVVVIHPVGGGAQDAVQRGRDELSLLTAGHLYHMISRGGSRPVLTRADDLPALRPGGPTAEALIERCREARAHLVLGIDFSPPPAGVRPADDPLARALGKAVDAVAVVSLADLTPVLPAVVVHLPMPAEGMPPAERRRLHIAHAEKLFQGLRAYAQGHREPLQADRDARWPASPDDEVKPMFGDRDQERRYRASEAVRAIWPHGDLPLDKAAWFAGLFRRVSLSDRTAVYFEPRVRLEGSAVVIEGVTNSRVLLPTLETAYAALGLKQVRNRMRLLPDEQKLGGELFGACVVPSALTFREPTEASRGETQLLYGEPVFLLDAEAGFLLVQASDGYCGWVRRDAVGVMERDAFRRYTADPHAVFIRNVPMADGWILRGSRLPVRAEQGDTVSLELPTGGQFDVSRSQVRLVDTRPMLEQRARTALGMLYTPYVFAGRSPLGVDCSGLVTNVCEDEGTPIARDAAQQFLSGKLVATAWYRDDLQPGDRVYFIDPTGKIFHTGIAISGTHFVHSSSPGVKINSLSKDDALYDADWDRAFLGAKRP